MARTGNHNLRRRRKLSPVPESKPTGQVEQKGIGCCKALLLLFTLIISLLVAYLLYAYTVSPISAVVIDDFPTWQERRFRYGPANALQSGLKLQPSLVGAESIAFDDNGNLYSGLADGRLIKIQPSKTLAVYDSDFETLWTTETLLQSLGEKRRMNARVLGIRYRDQKLYVVDVYQGVIVYDISSKQLKRIVSYDDVDPPLLFPDDLDITKDGRTLYFTDASSRWAFHHTLFEAVEGRCTGRVFKVDLPTGRVELFAGNLCFANGVQLSPDGEKLLVSETTRMRVRVFDVKTVQIEKTIVLPGTPDNIRSSKDGGYWVGIPVQHDPSTNFLHGYPSLRTVIAGILGTDGLFAYADKSKGVVAKLDENGELEGFLQDPIGQLSKTVTQVTETKEGHLFLGSFVSAGIIRIRARDFTRSYRSVKG